MTATAARRFATHGFGVWLGLAVLVNAVAFAATHLTHRPEVAYGAAFDVAVTVPALYYVLVVRSGRQSALTMLPLCVLALLRAMYVAPGAAALRPALGGVAELAVIGLLVSRVRTGLRAGTSREDIVERVRHVALEMVRAPALAEILATEVAVVYYAFAWRARPHVPEGARAFSVHRETGVGGWFGCLAVVSVIEAAVVHLIVAHSSVLAAWLLTALSVYGAVWLIAIARSFALRPILVVGSELVIRSGLVATLRVPLAGIASATSISDAGSGDWNMIPLSAPNLRLTFATPIEGSALYGRKRTVREVALAVDEPSAFVAALGIGR